jgi:hypothetical protein
VVELKKLLLPIALAASVIVAGCTSSPAGTSTTTTTATPSSGDLGTVPTTGWIIHTIRGGGVVMSIKTPPTWDHELTPSMNGGAASSGTTYVSNFALHAFCYHRKGVIGCAPGRSGRLPPNSGVLSVTEYTNSSATIPTPHASSQGGLVSSIDGYPAVAHLPDDARCTSLADFVTYYYEVSLWVPAGAQLNFCFNGPDIERLEATMATIAASVTFRSDPRSTAAPVTLFGQTTTNGGYSSKGTACTNSEVTPSVSATVAQAAGRTTIGVTTKFSQATSSPCGMPPLSTCGFYGDFAVYAPAGNALWTWEPMTLGAQCIGGVWLLPVTITVPSWSVPTKLLSKGTYTVRMVSIINGRITGPVLASTTFHIG